MRNKLIKRRVEGGNKSILKEYSRLIRQSSNGVKHRLKVLKLAEELGNVSEACRRSGTDRTSFYVYKRRFDKYGVNGLKDLPPVHRSHPDATQPCVVEKMLALSSENPKWGCAKLSEELKSNGISRSPQTVQELLIKEGLGTKQERFAMSNNSGCVKL